MTIDNAKEWLRLNDLPDIAVKKRGAREIVFSHSVEVGQGKISDTIEVFEKNIALVQPGRYVLIGKAGSKSGAAQRVFEFDIDDTNHISGTGIDSGSIGQIVASQVQVEMKVFKAEMEVVQLKAKNVELESQLKAKNSWQPRMEFFAEKSMEAFMKLTGNFQKAVDTETAAPASENGGGVAGMEKEEAEAMDERANAAFDTLVQKVGGDLVPALEALAAKDPEQLKQLLNYIK